LMVEGSIFFILYGQMQTSMNFFAINNVEHSLLGFAINPLSFQSLNPFWVVVLSPPLAYLYIKLREKGIRFSIYNKFATGMFLCACAFFVLYISKFFATESGEVSSNWLVLCYFLQSSGELMISALGVAMVAELVPSKIAGFAMGMWFAFSSVGLLLSGYVATIVALPEDLTNKVESLNIYADTFLMIGLFAFVASLIMFAAKKYKAKLI
jgi:POT family proton-dependent oligopeptide transporter